jgi:dihydrofolate reductase
MTRVKVAAFSISVDGFGAGPEQSLDCPLGRGGEGLHEWFIPTRGFKRVYGKAGGSTGIDDGFAARSMENLGAWIMGRNMFGPIRGRWPDFEWQGWWGDDPPYHCPVFVLTHHERPPLEMKGGTVFHFVTGGIRDALDRARRAAGGKDIRIGGGAGTIRQYLEARLIDEMHLAIAPVILGNGESLLGGINLPQLGYEVVDSEPGEAALHVMIGRK